MLGTEAEPALVDTIVMSNLAYFQLKASPGLFSLSLAPGRSRQLYAIDGGSGAGTAPDQACLHMPPWTMFLAPSRDMHACTPCCTARAMQGLQKAWWMPVA